MVCTCRTGYHLWMQGVSLFRLSYSTLRRVRSYEKHQRCRMHFSSVPDRLNATVAYAEVSLLEQ